MITITELTHGIRTFWLAAPTITAPTMLFPPQRDMSRIAQWYELWVDVWDEPVQRRAAPQHWNLFITVHAFSQQRSAERDVLALANAALQTLTGQQIEISSATAANEKAIVSLREGRWNDLTRQLRTAGQPALEQIVVTFPAKAESFLQPTD